MSGPIRHTVELLKAFAVAAGLSLEDAADTLDRWNARQPKPSRSSVAAPDPQAAALVPPIVPTDPPSGKVH